MNLSLPASPVSSPLYSLKFSYCVSMHVSSDVLSTCLVLLQANENEAEKVLFEDRTPEKFMV